MELCSDWDDCYFALVQLISVFTVTSVVVTVTSLIGIFTLVPWITYFAKMAARQATILSYMFRKPVKVDPAQHGGTLVAKVLKSHGVDVVFTLSGGHISPVLVGAEKLGEFYCRNITNTSKRLVYMCNTCVFSFHQVFELLIRDMRSMLYSQQMLWQGSQINQVNSPLKVIVLDDFSHRSFRLKEWQSSPPDPA